MTRAKNTLIASLSVLALLVVALSAVAAAAATSGGAARVESVSVPSSGVDRANVHLAPDVAQLRLHALPTGSASLIDGTVALLANERLERDVRGGTEARVALRARSGFGVNASVRGPAWELGVSPDVPTRLRVRSGVADIDLDLRGTRVEALDSVTDVGRQTIHLPDHDMTGRLRTDMGRIELIVPHDADARVLVRAGLRRVSADPDFRREDGAWRLDGDGATLDLTVRAGMGEVVLRRAPN